MARLRDPQEGEAGQGPISGPPAEESGPIFNIPPPTDPNGGQGQSGETPRERRIQDLPDPSGSGPYNDSQHNQIHPPTPGSSAAPSRPRSPQSMAGSMSPGGVTPFSPMSDMSTSSGPQMALGRLFGQAGGLKGGGLGVPLDPASNQESDPISQLIKMITGGGGQ